MNRRAQTKNRENNPMQSSESGRDERSDLGTTLELSRISLRSSGLRLLRRTSRLIHPTRSVTVMRKSSGQSPDNGGRGYRRDQMFQGVSGDEAESGRDLVVEHLDDLGHNVQHHRAGEGDAIGARGAMDRLP